MKVLRKIGLGFAFALISVGLFSCSDDDENEIPSVEPEKEATASYTYTVEVNDEFLKLADITVSVAGPGETKKEAITSKSYKKEFTLKSFPETVSAGVTYQWKEGVDAAAADGKTISMAIKYSVSTSTGAVGTASKTISHTLEGENIEPLREADLEVLKAVNKTYTFTKGANGKVDFTLSKYEF